MTNRAEILEVSDQILGHAVAEILLLGIPAHVGEREHRDRGLLRHDRGWRLRSGNGLRRRGDAKHLYGLGDILELAFAQILEHELRRIGDEIAHPARDEDRARLRDVLEPRRDVDAVAINVAVLDHHVAKIDADAEFDPLPLGDVGVALRHGVLHVDRAAHRFDRACELGEHAVARGLDQAPLVLGDFRLDQFAPVGGKPRERTLLVGADEPRITRDIRCENGGKPTLHGWLLLREGPTAGPAMGCRGLLYGGLDADRQVPDARCARRAARKARGHRARRRNQPAWALAVQAHALGCGRAGSFRGGLGHRNSASCVIGCRSLRWSSMISG
jgi:hypothetical protein